MKRCPSCNKPCRAHEMFLVDKTLLCSRCCSAHLKVPKLSTEAVLRALADEARQREVERILRALAADANRRAEQERSVRRVLRDVGRKTR